MHGDAVIDATDSSVGRLLADARLPASEARMLLAAATGRSREALIAHPDASVDPDAARRFRDWAAARRGGMPVAYLLGTRAFFGRDFAVTPDVLIPRPETELVVERALAHCRALASHGRRPRVLDLGTGSGAIAITLALEAPEADVVATDLDDAALVVARGNATNLRSRVAFARGDWFDALDEADRRFDVIVANPPYVASADPHLAAGDLRFEPRHALTDGGDGLGACRAIVPGAFARLAPGGWCIVEHGHDQADAVRGLFAMSGFERVTSSRDLAGIERTVEGRRPDADL